VKYSAALAACVSRVTTSVFGQGSVSDPLDKLKFPGPFSFKVDLIRPLRDKGKKGNRYERRVKGKEG